MKLSKKGSKASYIIGLLTTSLSIITIISAVLLSIPITNAETVASNASISVGMACSMAVTPGTGGTATSDGYSYSATVTPGIPSVIDGSILTTTCNGPGNYSLYAIGYSGDSYDTPTNTQMIGSGTSAGINIATGTATSGGTSNWAFKLSSVDSDPAPTIISPYNNFANVPGADFAKVATMLGTTGLASTSKVQAKYQVYASTSQAAGSYTGKVKYTMVYPNDAPAPSTQISLYDAVASMSKGPQTVAELRTAIDTSNSGVYEYDPSVFGTASDAANTSTIYYYRGILDNTVGSYGSDGDNAAWPNTVLLDTTGNGKDTSDTCWRIVRTTGSGGVKMIYQGKWTGSTCANAETSAQVITRVFGIKGNSSQSTYWYRNINRVGYTFNNTASIQDITTATSVDTVFGSDSSPSTNNERSNIKEYIEDTWYASNMTSYTSKLEASAGYCNDRTAYSNITTSTSLSTIPPYASSSAAVYFGAYGRNANATNAGKKPSLTCPRSTVDLYRYVSGSTGVSNQLKYPAALLTADEVSFAGSGRSTASQGSAYHANSYLRSGSSFWLLSPFTRSSDITYGFILDSNGYMDIHRVGSTNGVRPAISLASGTTATSGTGTATDPWIVNP